MNKFYDQEINKHQDWGGDESTSNLPVTGFRVQEFIKNTLDQKAGFFWYDELNNRYLVFSDEESKNLYVEDPLRTDLLIGTFDAPFNYSVKVNLFTPTYNAIQLGKKGNYLDFSFSVENKNGQPTGESVIVRYNFRRGSVSNTLTETYNSGDIVHFNIDDYLEEGTNTIIIAVTGKDSLASTTLSVTYQVVDLTIDADIDISKTYNLSEGLQTISIPFRVSGYGTKVVEWYLDNELLEFEKDVDEIVDPSIERTKYITLSNLSEGVHSLQVRVYTTVESERFYSDVIYSELIVFLGNSNNIITSTQFIVPSQYGILSERKLYGVTQYIPYTLTFATYNPLSPNSLIEISLDNQVLSTVKSSNFIVNNFNIVSKKSGDYIIKLGDYSLPVNINQTTMNISEITNNLVFDFTAQGKSNSSTDKDVWSYGEYTGTFTGFDWNNTSGWNDDYLIINEGATFEVNYKPLKSDPSITGKTIEIEFESTQVRDDSTVLLDLGSIVITASSVKMISQDGVVLETSYKDNELNRIVFTINKSASSTNKCLSFITVNGILSRAVSWANTDKYTSDKTLKFVGSEGACIKLRNIRIYNQPLSSDQLLNNYIIYQSDINKMSEIYDRNNIYKEGTSVFDPDKMVSRLPVMIITGDIPVLEATTDKNLQITVDIDYTNLQDPSKSFKLVSAALRPQGTSSMGYPKKNYRFYTQKLKDTILYDSEGKVVSDKLYSFKEGAQKVNCWCLKADYAESSGTHNTGIAKLWNRAMTNCMIDGEYKLRTEAQKQALINEFDGDVRTTIDGFPILLFYRLSRNDQPIFIGKYNFNNDKSTPSVFGFEGVPGFDNSRMQCWEVLNNGSPLALFKTLDNFDTTWDEAWEARYPDGSKNTEDLKIFASWMVNVTQDGFAEEKWNHLDVYKVAAYYIYLMRFGAVDQTVKNAMLTSEDGLHFFYINYDNDTINGLTNDGKLVVPPYADRTTIGADGQTYYAGPDSRFWNLCEKDREFMEIVRKVDESLYQSGLAYKDVIDVFDNEQASKWVERVYNQDSQYKYIGPKVDSSIDNLFMLQGNRSQHRKYWLAKRFSYFDSKFVSGAYKANSIEFKLTNKTPSGQTFTIIAGSDMDYGYGVNNNVVEGNVTLNTGDPHTFTTRQEINLGDPIRIYAAPNIDTLWLNQEISSKLAVLNIDKVYDANINSSKLKELRIGNREYPNNVLLGISGLSSAIELERLYIEAMKEMRSLDLSNQYKIKEVCVEYSNIASITLPKGSTLEYLSLSSAFKTLLLEDQPRLKILESNEVNFAGITSFTLHRCPLITKFDLIQRWFNNNSDNTELTLDLDSINWTNIDASEFITVIQGLKSYKLLGRIGLENVTPELMNTLSSLFDESVFRENENLFIVVPDAVYITIPSEMIEGDSLTLTAIVRSSYPGTVSWSIVGGGDTYQSISGNVLTTRDPGLTRTITIQATHTSTKGEVTSSTAELLIWKVIRVLSCEISGNDILRENSDYSLTINPTNVNKPYSVTWSLSGEGFDNGYVSIANQTNSSCSINLLDTKAKGNFTITSTVNLDNGKTVTASKTVKLGTVLTINISSNQGNNDPSISSAACNGNYTAGGTRHDFTLTNGQSVNLPYNVQVNYSFTNISGYKNPGPGGLIITEDTVKTYEYKTEVVNLNLSAYDGGNLSGTIVRINGTDYTYQGTTIQVKIAHDTSYTIEFNSVKGYNSPSKLSYTASQVSRSITANYTKTDPTIYIDQTIKDPASMISGDVNNDIIQAIRAGSHRYLGKSTEPGTMSLCQLSDNDSTKYFDGTDADLTGAEGDVFVKLPAFFYKLTEVSTDVWSLQFKLELNPPEAGWTYWDTNALIGAYEAYSTSSKVYSRSGIASSGNISQANFKKYARNRGIGFQIVDWQMHCVMALLYFSEYGHTNCQDKIGAGTNSNSKVSGQTNSCGMNDTKGANPVSGLNDSGVDGNTQSINFWGLENWWGNKKEWIDNVVVDSNVWTITEPDETERTASEMGHNSGGYISKLLFDGGDLIPTGIGGSGTTGFCDDYYGSSSNASVVRRSYERDHPGGGVVYVYASDNSSSTSSDAGSRLAFRGSCNIVENVSTFKGLSAIEPNINYSS